MLNRLAWLSLLFAATLLPAQQTAVFRYGTAAVEVTLAGDEVAFGFTEEDRGDALVAARPDLFAATIQTFPLRQTMIVRTRAGRRDDAVQWLRSDAGVRFAHPLYHLGDPDHPDSRQILTEEFVVRFRDAVSPATAEAVIVSYGASIARSISWLTGGYIVAVPRTASALDIANEFAARDDVLFAHPNWLRPLGVRQTTVNDPLFGNQWHLENTGQGGGVVGADIRATFAWDHTMGAGRVIAIVDTGVDSTHIDINQTTNGYNPLFGAGPTVANDTAGHGTSCAGVAAATGNNGILLSGVAPAATIMPIKLLNGAGWGTPTEESDSFMYAVNNGADVISASYGPDGVPWPLPSLVDAAFQSAVTSGRGGLGIPIFWAAGNGNEDISTDGYVSSPYTIAVGATTNLDVRASYSDYGVGLDIVAPSSGGTRQINTVIPADTWTSNFGGTSAAAPEAAGVAALILDVAPTSTWSDVRTILHNSANPIQPALANYDANGHSLTYGYGRLDADQAVLDAMASAPQPPTLAITTTGIGDVLIDIQNMLPGDEFILAASMQAIQPIGSGPLFGVGLDAFPLFALPAGTIPFHVWSDGVGRFYWGTTGVPLGLTIQAVAVELRPGPFGPVFTPSNVVQTSF